MNDIDEQILFKSSYIDIHTMSMVNKDLNNKSHDEWFWKYKFIHDYGRTNETTNNWKSFYFKQYKKDTINKYMSINSLQPKLNSDVLFYVKQFL